MALNAYTLMWEGRWAGNGETSSDSRGTEVPQPYFIQFGSDVAGIWHIHVCQCCLAVDEKS